MVILIFVLLGIYASHHHHEAVFEEGECGSSKHYLRT